MSLARYLVNASIPITKFIGSISFVPKKLVTEEDYYYSWKMLKPGYSIVTTTKYHLSNAFIPGFFKHLGVYCPDSSKLVDELVIEAVSPVVKSTNLVYFLTTKDYYAVIKPKFLDEKGCAEVAKVCRNYLKKPYDFAFEMDTKAFYCAEVYYKAISDVLGKVPFEAKERFGEDTVSPQDFADLSHLFEIVTASQSVVKLVDSGQLYLPIGGHIA